MFRLFILNIDNRFDIQKKESKSLKDIYIYIYILLHHGCLLSPGFVK